MTEDVRADVSPAAGEADGIRLHARTAPTRCPFCHADVDREREPWVACRGCLVRHHTPCWSEGKGCSSCGGTLSIEGNARRTVPATQAPRSAPTPAVLVGSSPGALEADPATLTIDLRVQNEHEAEVDAVAPIVVVPGRESRFSVEVSNPTGLEQRVELRRLPPWLRAEGSPVVLQPGARATLRLVVVEEFLPSKPDDSQRRVPEERETAFEGVALQLGTFLVSSEDDVQVVSVCVWRVPSLRVLVGIGVLGGVVPWPLGAVMLVGTLLTIAPRFRRRGATAIETEFFRRRRVAMRRAALVVLAVLVPLLSAVGFFIMRSSS